MGPPFRSAGRWIGLAVHGAPSSDRLQVITVMLDPGEPNPVHDHVVPAIGGNPLQRPVMPGCNSSSSVTSRSDASSSARDFPTCRNNALGVSSDPAMAVTSTWSDGTRRTG